jgi:hypothetical protein
VRNRYRLRKFFPGLPSHSAASRETTRAKRNRANRTLLSGKRFDATEDRSHNRTTDAVQSVPRSCIRYQSQENLLKRTKIVLAVPSYHRQRLSGIRRGWCPSQSAGTERVIRSDSGVAHRLSLSGRVLSAEVSQVKAKQQGVKCLWRLRIRRAREFHGLQKSRRYQARKQRIVRVVQGRFRKFQCERRNGPRTNPPQDPGRARPIQANRPT